MEAYPPTPRWRHRGVCWHAYASFWGILLGVDWDVLGVRCVQCVWTWSTGINIGVDTAGTREMNMHRGLDPRHPAAHSHTPTHSWVHLKRDRTNFSLCPYHLERKSAADTANKVAWDSVVTAWANSVFPVPGGGERVQCAT